MKKVASENTYKNSSKKMNIIASLTFLLTISSASYLAHAEDLTSKSYEEQKQYLQSPFDKKTKSSAQPSGALIPKSISADANIGKPSSKYSVIGEDDVYSPSVDQKKFSYEVVESKEIVTAEAYQTEVEAKNYYYQKSQQQDTRKYKTKMGKDDLLSPFADREQVPTEPVGGIKVRREKAAIYESEPKTYLVDPVDEAEVQKIKEGGSIINVTTPAGKGVRQADLYPNAELERKKDVFDYQGFIEHEKKIIQQEQLGQDIYNDSKFREALPRDEGKVIYKRAVDKNVGGSSSASPDNQYQQPTSVLQNSVPVITDPVRQGRINQLNEYERLKSDSVREVETLEWLQKVNNPTNLEGVNRNVVPAVVPLIRAQDPSIVPASESRNIKEVPGFLYKELEDQKSGRRPANFGGAASDNGKYYYEDTSLTGNVVHTESPAPLVPPVPNAIPAARYQNNIQATGAVQQQVTPTDQPTQQKVYYRTEQSSDAEVDSIQDIYYNQRSIQNSLNPEKANSGSFQMNNNETENIKKNYLINRLKEKLVFGVDKYNILSKYSSVNVVASDESIISQILPQDDSSDKRPVNKTAKKRPVKIYDKSTRSYMATPPASVAKRPMPKSPRAKVRSSGSTMESLLADAYNRNPEINSAREALKAADESLPQAFSGILPSLDLNYSYADTTSKAPGSQERSYNPETKSITLSQGIFGGGETYYAINSAEQRIMGARFELSETEQSFLLTAINSYIEVIFTKKVLMLAENNERVLNEQLKATKERFIIGDATRTDVAQSEARLANTVSSRVVAAGDYTNAKSSFRRIFLVEPSSALPMPTGLPDVPDTFDQALSIALQKSPNLNRASFLKALRESEIDERQSQLFPQVDLDASVGERDSVSGSSLFTTESETLTLNVTVPLYQGGQTYSRIREATDRAKQSDFEYQNTLNIVRDNLIRAWQGLTTTATNIEATKASLIASEYALEGVREEQKEGLRTILDVLDAEQERFQSEVSHARAIKDSVLAVYSLKSAMGELDVRNLGLSTPEYDPAEHYEKTKYKFIGL